MPSTKRILLAALLLAVAAGGLDARNVFVMPSSGGQTINIFAADPLGTPASLTSSPGAFLALARPDGARYYVVSRSSSDSLVILDSNFQVLARKPIGEDIRAAAITPDGRRLVVLASTLRVFDTETGNEVVPPTSPEVGAVPTDVTVSQDSKRAFVLSLSAQRVIAIDISGTAFPVVGNVFLGGGEYSGITTGPNGLIYASLTNQVVVIDPTTVTRIDPALGVNGLPGRLAFTGDGQRAIAVNRLTVTGASAFVFDLRNGTTANVPTMGQTLEEIVVAGSNRAFAISNGQLLYDIALSPAAITQAVFAGSSSFSGVTGFAVSNELPAAKYLYVAVSPPGVLDYAVNRIDLANNTGSGRAPLATPTGKVSFAGPASLGPAVAGLPINNSQNVRPGAALAPLIARFLDANGKPVAGAPVSWSAGSADVVITQRGSVTTPEGYVQALVTAPSTSGTYKVSATSGTAVVEFAFLVTTGGGGGGSVTPTGAGIFIYSGNGQLVPEQALSNEPLVVLVRDVNGAPAVGQQVTFEVTQGPITLTGSVDYSCSGLVCVTDSKGRAGIGFTTSALSSLSSYSQAIVTAKLADGTGVPFNIVVFLRFNPDSSPALQPQVLLITPESGQVLRGAVGSTLVGAVQARVAAGGILQSGQPLANVGMRVSTEFEPADGPTVSCQPNLLSDASGLISCDLTFGGKLGQTQMSITIGGGQFVQRRNIEVTAGAPAQLRKVQGDNQSGNPGQKLPLPVYVEVSDVAGNLLSGVPVSWEIVQPGTMTLGNVRTTTDSNGKAFSEVTLGQAPGVVALRVKSGTATVTFNFTVNVRITKLTKMGGDGQAVGVNQPYPQPLAVQVLDDQNRPVPGAAVGFSVVGGGAGLSASTVNTDTNGRAAVTVTAGSQAGTIQVRAFVGTLSETFTLIANPPGPVVIPRDFRNAAGGQPGVTPGGLAIISGRGLAPGIQGLQVAALTLNKLPTLFLGVEVQFGGVLAPIFWVSNQGGVEEVAVQVPFEVPVGTSTVSIRSPGGGPPSLTDVQVLPVQPGVFASVVGGQRYAIATRPDGSFVAPDNPAQRGEILRFYATGLGQTSPATATNRAGVPGQAVLAIMIAGLNDAGVRIVSAEYLPGSIGIYVIAIEVPATTAAGAAVPLGFGVQAPDGTTVFANSVAVPIQ